MTYINLINGDTLNTNYKLNVLRSILLSSTQFICVDVVISHKEVEMLINQNSILYIN